MKRVWNAMLRIAEEVMIEKAGPEGYTKVLEGARLKVLAHGESTMITEFRLDKGALIPAHDHPHEQTGYLVSGSLRFFSGSESIVAAPGDSWNLPSNKPHGAEALEDCVMVEVFSPVREDYLSL